MRSNLGPKGLAVFCGVFLTLYVYGPFASGSPVPIKSFPSLSNAAEKNAQPASHENLWVLQDRLLSRIDTGSLETKSELAAHNAHALAIDELTGILWYVDRLGLNAVTNEGSLVFSEPVELTKQVAVGLAVDGKRGFVWVATPNELFQMSVTGQHIASFRLNGIQTAPVVDTESGAVWVLSKGELVRLDHSGRISKTGLDRVEAIATARHGGGVWAATKDRVVRLPSNGPAVAAPWPHDLGNVRYLADDGRGGVWLVSNLYVEHLNAQGVQTLAIQPLISGLLPIKFSAAGRINSLWADPRDGSAWLVMGVELFNVSIDGQLLAARSLARPNGPIVGGTMQVDDVPPEVWIVSPVAESYTNNSTPVVSLTYNDVGTGVDPSSIQLFVEGEPVQSSCNATADEATCEPLAEISDGYLTLSVTVEDYAGNEGRSEDLRFSVDTVPPELTISSPESGSITNVPEQVLAGSVSEFATLSLDGEVIPLDANHAFSMNLETQEGFNSWRIKATDRATNSAQVLIQLTLDTMPPAPPSLGSISVTALSDGEVEITGTVGSVEPHARITIRNETTGEEFVVTANANGEFKAAVRGSIDDIYTVTATDDAGNSSTPVETVPPVSGPKDPSDPVETAPPLSSIESTPFSESVEFLYNGIGQVQFDVDETKLSPRRLSVIRGQLITREGAPLEGVVVTVKDHPEFGYTKSRVDGKFDIAVNGGGTLTVDFTSEQHLPAQRKLSIPWNGFATMDQVALISLDPLVTRLDLASLTDIAVAKGSHVEDQDGSRQAVVLVPPGTSATMTLPDGTQQMLPEVSIRATEYTVGPNGPNAMPGELPPTTGYTYAVELSVDEAIEAGATRVDFSQPLPFYVDNFLNFPAGTAVPLGWYDRTKSAWIPTDSGTVVEVLGETNGLAQVDADGDGEADDELLRLSIGLTDAELRVIADLYETGESFWRVTVSHFTPYDCNWPFGFPDDAIIAPQNEEEDPVDSCDSSTLEQCFIEVEEQVLGEQFHITGTSHLLTYRSDLVRGRNTRSEIKVPLGDDLPPSLIGILVKVSVAGVEESEVFPPEPGQIFEYTWDGKDAYGRDVVGAVEATVSIGYEYQGVYGNTSRFGNVGDGGVLTGDPARETVMTWRVLKRILIRNPEKAIGMNGWTVSGHHHFETAGDILQLGNGTRRQASSFASFAGGVAGTGFRSYTPDGTPAEDAGIDPESIAVSPSGEVYMAEYDPIRYRHGVRRIATDGKVYWLPGRFDDITDIALGPDGSVFVADPGEQRIWRIWPNGQVTLFAGVRSWIGDGAFEGDGGPATEARLNYPTGLAVANDGTVFIADSGNHRIRRVDTDGLIWTVAGSGPIDTWMGGYQGGYEGDGGLAINARLGRPRDVAVDEEGNLYIAGLHNVRIRRVDPDGIISTIAGNGTPSSWGSDAELADGVLATDAAISPARMAFDQSGRLFFYDSGRYLVRMIRDDGTIKTVAGNGGTQYEGSGRPALESSVYGNDIAWSPDGGLYVSAHRRIVRMSPIDSVIRAVGEVPVPSADGREVYIFNKDGRHLRTVSTDFGQTVKEFEYDVFGRLSAIVELGANSITFDYDDNARVLRVIASSGQVTTLQSDIFNNVTKVTNPAGEDWELNYYDGSLLREIRDPARNVYAYTYDTRGRLTSETAPMSGGVNITRTDADIGHSVTATTPDGHSTIYQVGYSDTGDLQTSVTYPFGGQLTKERPDNDTVVAVTPDGTRYEKNYAPDPRFGFLAPYMQSETVVLPSGLTSTSFRSRTVDHDEFEVSAGRDTVLANGRETTVVLDVPSRTVVTTTPEGRTSTVRYDSEGRVASVETSGLAPMSYTYNADGTIETVSEGVGADKRTAAYSYYTSGPTEGMVESVTDAAGRVSVVQYDLAGRIISESLSGLTGGTFGYDSNGNLESITPPGRPAHQRRFNSADLLGEYVPPAGSSGSASTVYTYTPDWQPESIVWPGGETTTFTYSPENGRLESKQTPVGVYDYDYLASGQLGSVSSPDGVALNFAYDGFLEKSMAWQGAVNGQVAVDYDSNFVVKSMTIAGESIGYGYDDDLLLVQAGSMSVTRNINHGLVDATSLGVVSTAHAYNEFGEVEATDTAVAGSSLFSVNYIRDALGRIERKTETINGTTTTYDYTYTQIGELETVSIDGSLVREYRYDTNSNRTHTNGVIVGNYDDQDRLLQSGGCTFTYATDGSLDKKNCTETIDFDYDSAGNLRRIALPSGDLVEYLHDGLNRRVGKKVNGTLVQGFLYKDDLNPVAELDGSGNVVSRFVYGDKATVPSYMVKDGSTYRVVSDELGSPRLIVDVATGIVVQRIDYDEWGQIVGDTNPGFQPFGFAGGLVEQATGLVRFGARDYDPATGRWVSKDPSGFVGGFNFYAYVNNDPINFVDPLGLFCLSASEIAAYSGFAGGFLAGAMAVGKNPASAILGGLLGGIFGAGFGWTGANSENQAMLQGGAIGVASSLNSMWTGGIGGLLAGSTAYTLEQAGMDPMLAQVIGGTLGGALGVGSVYLYFGGPKNVSGPKHLQMTGKAAIKGGRAGLAGALVQGGLQKWLEANNDCGCQPQQ